jgi:hypothetical protein
MQKDWKKCSNITMVEVQTWSPWKIVHCDNIFDPLVMCFHPLTKFNQSLIKVYGRFSQLLI